MRLCKNCGVKLLSDLGRCPLCDMETTLLDDRFEEDYPYIRHGRPITARRIITFAAVAAALICLIIDHYVPTGTHWALLTVAAIAYAWFNVLHTLKNRRDPGSIAFGQYLSLNVLLLAVDLLCGWKRWSIDYVLPFLTAGAALCFLLMIAIRPERYFVCTVYLTVTLAVGAGLWLLAHFSPAGVEWPTAAAAAVPALCVAVIAVFARHRTHNALQKHFHIR